MPSVDLNSDLGEGFGTYRCGDDEAMLAIVTSANFFSQCLTTPNERIRRVWRRLSLPAASKRKLARHRPEHPSIAKQHSFRAGAVP